MDSRSLHSLQDCVGSLSKAKVEATVAATMIEVEEMKNKELPAALATKEAKVKQI